MRITLQSACAICDGALFLLPGRSSCLFPYCHISRNKMTVTFLEEGLNSQIQLLYSA